MAMYQHLKEASVRIRGSGPSPAKSIDGTAARNEGLVLQIGEGERRVRRNAGKGGAEIQLHRHLVADEILFVHRGAGLATLGGRDSRVSAGATIYIPRSVTIGLVNTGNEPLGIAFVFSRPSFEELMRDNSVLEGQPVTPISAEERAQIKRGIVGIPSPVHRGSVPLSSAECPRSRSR